MKTPLCKRYADRRPVGSVCLCNTFGVLVFEPMEEDKPDTDFITAWSGSESQTWGYHRNTVHYTAAGRGYLRKGSLRLYLDELDCYFVGDEFCLSNYAMGAMIYNCYSDLVYIINFNDIEEILAAGRWLRLYAKTPDTDDREIINEWRA